MSSQFDLGLLTGREGGAKCSWSSVSDWGGATHNLDSEWPKQKTVFMDQRADFVPKIRWRPKKKNVTGRRADFVRKIRWRPKKKVFTDQRADFVPKIRCVPKKKSSLHKFIIAGIAPGPLAHTFLSMPMFKRCPPKKGHHVSIRDFCCFSDYFQIKNKMSSLRNAQVFAQIKLFFNQIANFSSSSVTHHIMLYGPLVENHWSSYIKFWQQFEINELYVCTKFRGSHVTSVFGFENRPKSLS